jgi:aspartate kinase
VFSNASAFRMAADVPLLVPEANADHLALVDTQRAARGWKGAIVCNPNCTATVLVMGLAPLQQAFGIERVFMTSMQAISGAGYPGVPSLDIMGNVIPFIKNEEEKVEEETPKMLGRFAAGAVLPAPFSISAMCHRVPVLEGHSEAVSVTLRGNPSIDAVREAFPHLARGRPRIRPALGARGSDPRSLGREPAAGAARRRTRRRHERPRRARASVSPAGREVRAARSQHGARCRRCFGAERRTRARDGLSRMSLILKFGGSSVADAACMRRVADLAKAALGRSPVVVLSAMGKTTDALFAAARLAEHGDTDGALAAVREILAKHRGACEDLFSGSVPEDLETFIRAAESRIETLLRGVSMLHELSARSRDAIVAHGELLSSQILAAFLASSGVPTAWLDVRRVMRTDARFGSAEPQTTAIAALAKTELLPLMGPNQIVVTQGYVGATKDDTTTTLGRGGSDYSASLLGAAIGAEEVQIWTDVEGVLTADPRIVPDASPILELSFREAAELAAFGAKVLHPATIQPAVDADIPVTVRHTMRPDGRFSTITATGGRASSRPATAIASRGPIHVITIESTRMLAQSGFLAASSRSSGASAPRWMSWPPPK